MECNNCTRFDLAKLWLGKGICTVDGSEKYGHIRKHCQTFRSKKYFGSKNAPTLFKEEAEDLCWDNPINKIFISGDSGDDSIYIEISKDDNVAEISLNKKQVENLIENLNKFLKKEEIENLEVGKEKPSSLIECDF